MRELNCNQRDQIAFEGFVFYACLVTKKCYENFVVYLKMALVRSKFRETSFRLIENKKRVTVI
jgi:hypothetical protein